jgi:hypothetical protein
MDDVQRRVEDIRKRREEEASAKQNELRDRVLTYQAEAILALETVNFIEELTDDTDLYEYALNKLRSHGIRIDTPPSLGKGEWSLWKWVSVDRLSFEAILNQRLTIPLDKKENCLIAHLIERIRAVKSSPEYIEKEIARKARIAEEARILAAKIAEEERIANEKKAQQELIYRTRVIEEANIFVKKFLVTEKIISNTFTELTVADWDTRNQYQFIIKLDWGSGEHWEHYKIPFYEFENHVIHNNVLKSVVLRKCYDDMPELFSNYSEEGKVPFCTKCPLCKSRTKFNYMKLYHNVHGGMGEQESHAFRQVYCNGHYFYDSTSNKHYIQDTNGEEITFRSLNMPHTEHWGYMCWTPSTGYFGNGGNQPTKWKEWDPTDPDGKRAEVERKENERDEIKKQIAELYAKLLAI